MGVVPAPIIELSCARIAVPGGLLNVLELGAVLERHGDKRGAHRLRRVAAIEPELGSVFPHRAVDRV
jgi:hypothetical protein